MSSVTVNNNSHFSPGLPGVNNGIGTFFTHGVTAQAGGFLDFSFLANNGGNSMINAGNTGITVNTAAKLDLFAANTTSTVLEFGTFTLFPSAANINGVANTTLSVTSIVQNADPVSTYTLSHTTGATSRHSHHCSACGNIGLGRCWFSEYRLGYYGQLVGQHTVGYRGHRQL